MPGVEALVEAFADRVLLRPRHDLPNFVDLAGAVARVCGVDIELTGHAEDMVDAIGTADHVVLTLADGVGMNMVEMLPEDSFLRSNLHSDILAVFPSTTSVALTSLTTAQWPAEHAIMGWWTYLPELNGVATILQYTDRGTGADLVNRGIDPERTFPVKSVWPRMTRDGLVVVPERIKDSVYSNFFNGGLESFGYRSLSEAVGVVSERVLNASEPTFTYLYVPRVDSLAHLHGMSRPEVKHALVEVDNGLSQLHSEIGDKARMVVTADHGLLDATAAQRHTLRPNREIQPLMISPPSGDARVMYLPTWTWAGDRMRRYFERRFGERFAVIDLEEAIKLEMLGPEPPSDVAMQRLGNQIAISTGPDMIEYNAARGQGRMVQLNCHHSGLTPEEMRIPFVVA